jgi:hypothetical protein
MAAATIRQAPWIAVLLQTMHDIIGNPVAFFFRQSFAKTAHEFARTSQRECYGKAQHVPTGPHWAKRTNSERLGKRV